MIDFAAVVIAVAFLVLVGYLVPTVVQLRRTVAQSERLLAQLNNELPGLLRELKGTSENVHAMTIQAKAGVDRASVLMNAIGEVGQTVHQVHGAVRGKGVAVGMKLARVFSGMRAAATTIKDRVHKEGG
ncbi:DUF948 domain-containing protein [Candidatus Nitronereus thalassa]|uniref:DUF948 domain-containing protein n=1 Tax=Candidatus Nitronereus thalassa TaxID=3020898 RepID=A0ABU3KC47_9BACT|nr:DUF948 domain-containing protein [Candidatus Nitronereus thalassa]MDT7044002.1 DUF948 domain-containing protein [Candidatus Nitronereus thalassa]